jgi:exodeoxyribonuclease V gamma subunit
LRATAAGDGASREDERWQAALWRALHAGAEDAGAGSGHPAQRFLAALEAGAAQADPERTLPARVHVFGVPTMPPLYLELLAGLGRHIDVDLYVLNPCREYWLDLPSQREQARRIVQGRAEHSEVGHRLLASWGRQSQAYLQLLLAQDGDIVLEEPDAVPPHGEATGSLLAALQQGIRDLVDLAPGSLCEVATPDASLEIHVCHSLTRELEVLHDRLLAKFAAPDPPDPGAILVAVPDLEAAAPLIEQVFGNVPRALHIPYTISGLPAAAVNPLARALLGVLDLAVSRVPLSALLGVLREPCVSARFAIAPADLAAITGLLHDAGVRWGYDAQHRADLDLPATARGTLSDGLERLWLGQLLPEAHSEPWQERLPPRSGARVDPVLLGSLQAFHTALGALRARLAEPRRPLEWQAVLEQALRDFIETGPADSDARSALLAVLQAQTRELGAAGRSDPLPVEVLLRALRDGLAGSAGGGVPAGAVTFAALSSLRLLPHRVVCILGLDDGVFPAPNRPVEFDLIAARPRLGDRQRGEDDRNLFLDLVLAARAALHLSYSGRSARDNSPRPPSVLLAELLDALVPALCPPGADAPTRAARRRTLVIEHPLQPFDERYFRAGAEGLPQSHRVDLASALRRRAAARIAPAGPDSVGGDEAGAEGEEGAPGDAALDAAMQAPFFPRPLPVPGPAERSLDPARLIRFLQHPARMLLADRLGIRLPERQTEWEDAEPFLPDFFTAERLAARVLPLLLENPEWPDADLRLRIAAGMDYPEGALASAALAPELARLRAFAREVSALRRTPEAAARSAALPVDDQGLRWLLAGPVDPQRGGRLCLWDYSDPQPRRQLAVWVRHLWACAYPAPQGFDGTLWVHRHGTAQLAPLPAATAAGHLAALVGLYAEGMVRPLHFYPRSACELVAADLAAARARFHAGFDGRPGEGDEPAWQLALRGVADPLDAEFIRCAELVWRPLREVLP